MVAVLVHVLVHVVSASRGLLGGSMPICGRAGGKWTTYRLMAQDAVDACLTSGKLPDAGPCATAHLQLRGARGYTPSLFTQVAQNYTVPHRPGAANDPTTEIAVRRVWDWSAPPKC